MILREIIGWIVGDLVRCVRMELCVGLFGISIGRESLVGEGDGEDDIFVDNRKDLASRLFVGDFITDLVRVESIGGRDMFQERR